MKNSINFQDHGPRIHKNPLFPSWRASVQVSFFASLLTILFLGFVFIVNYLFLMMSIGLLEESFTKIMSKETSYQIQNYISLQNKATNHFFHQGSNSIRVINNLFQIVQKGIKIEQPPNCLFNVETFDSYAFDCIFCYDFCEKSVPQNLSRSQSFIDLAALMTEYLAVLDLKRYTYFASVYEDQLFALFNATTPLSFRPHKRPWYIDHIKKMNESSSSVVSEPYFATVNLMFIAQSYNLTSLSGELVGVVAQDGDFLTIPRVQEKYIKPSILDINGNLIISSFYTVDVDAVYKFQNTSLTGYTEEDWHLLKKEADKNLIYSTSLQNRQLDETVLVCIIKMKWPEYYIIMQIDDSSQRDDQGRMFHYTKQFFQAYLLYQVYISIGTFIVIVIFELIFIRYLERDFNYLISIAKNRIFDNQKSFNYQIKIPKKNSTVHHLFLAYISMVENITRISKTKKHNFCYQMEQIQYPRNFISVHLGGIYKPELKLVRSLKLLIRDKILNTLSSRESPRFGGCSPKNSLIKILSENVQFLHSTIKSMLSPTIEVFYLN